MVFGQARRVGNSLYVRPSAIRPDVEVVRTLGARVEGRCVDIVCQGRLSRSHIAWNTLDRPLYLDMYASRT